MSPINPMKKILLPFAVLILAAAGWMMWISFLNTRTQTTQVIVSGSVDEVLIYRTTEPNRPVIAIQTGGQDTTRTVELPAAEAFSPFVQSRPAQYFFAARAGSQTHRGSLFCCETGLRRENGTLIIDGLQEWRFSH